MRTACCLGLALILLTACDGDREDRPPTAPPPADPEPAPEETAPEPAAEPAPAEDATPSTARSVEAAEAYAAIVRAYNARDREAYLAGFAPTLRCFYDRADMSHDAFAEQRWGDAPEGRLAVAKLDLLERSDDEVVFLDRGFWLESAGGRQVIHEKIVVLRRGDDGWRVVAETNRDGLGCLGVELDLASHASDGFEACRSEHRSCLRRCREAGCRSGCMDGALMCIGVRRPPGTADDAPGGALANVDEVTRFVRLSLADQLAGWGVEAGDEMSAEDARWVEAAQRRVGAPRIRAAARGGAECSAFLLPQHLASHLASIEAPAVRCTEARDRCVAALRVDRHEAEGEHYVLHLLFDGPDLRVSQLEGPSAAPPGLTSELGRFALRRPAAWDAACSPQVEALAEDRVGQDFWELRDAFDEDADVAVTRRCGPAAQRAARALGDRWTCQETTCLPPYMCGNYCEMISFDGDRLLSHAEGIAASPLSAAHAAALRPRVACGDTVALSLDEMP